MKVFSKFPSRFALAGLACTLGLGAAGCNGCNSSTQPAPITSAQNTDNGQDPALANMDASYNAPEGTSQPTQVLGQSSTYAGTQSDESYPTQGNYDEGYGPGYYDQAVYSDQAPPQLPEYDQPAAPADNDIWTPGYWAYQPTGYYWVPGAWVSAPYYGALWTPPYWGWYNHHYYFHHGYWGPHVGFYGGINYGFGYIGTGYFGGYWNHDHFWYNREVNRVGPGIGSYAYSRPVVYNNVTYHMQPAVRVAYNGGPGGIDRRPANFEVAAMRERHEAPLAVQAQAHQAAAQNRAQFFNDNHGRPQMVAAAQPYRAPGGIRATPADVHPGRPGFNGRPAENRPGSPMPQTMQHGAMPQSQILQHPQEMMRPQGPAQRPQEMNRPQERIAPGQGVHPGPQTTTHPAGPGQGRPQPQQMHQQPQAMHQPQPNHEQPQMRQQPQMHPQPQAQAMHPMGAAQPARPAPQQMPAAPQMHQAPQPMHQAAAPQMHQAPAPQIHQAPQPMHQAAAPQMHQAPAPQMHQAPAPQMHEAPHPAAPPAAALHGGGGHHR